MSDVPFNIRSMPWNGGQAKELAQAGSLDNQRQAQVQPADLPKAAKETPAEREQVEQVVAKLQDHLQRVERSLDFQMDDSTGRTVIKVFDRSSDTLIRQIPSEEALELAKRLGDSEPLGLFTAQV